MSNNGTDRDIAQQLVTLVDGLGSALDTIIDNCFSPHITAQPEDVTVAVGNSATFTVTATNARAYQWQYKRSADGAWLVVTAYYGYNTRSMTVQANADRYAYYFRCEITGLNGTKIYSDAVHMIEPEST